MIKLSARQRLRLDLQITLMQQVFKDPGEEILILDLGTEYGHTGRTVRNAYRNSRVVGVEVHGPTLQACREQEGHNYQLLIESDAIAFLEGWEGPRFNVIVAAEIIEHMHKETGAKLLKLLPTLGDFVIVTTPIGFLPMGAMYGNPYQIHRSGWDPAELIEADYVAFSVNPGLNLGVYYYANPGKLPS